MSALGDAVQRAWSQIEEAWPGLAMTPEALTEQLEARGISAEAFDGLRIVDLALALACGQGDDAALRHFEGVLRGAEPALRSIDSSPGFVEEVQQRVRMRLLVGDEERPPRIVGYAGRGPLVAWTTVTAIRTAISYMQENARAHRFSEDRWAATLLLPPCGDTELEHLKDHYRTQMAEALRRAVGRLDDRERAVMRLHFAQALSIDKIGKIYGVHRATVARWIAKTRDELAGRVATILEQELAIPAEELSSLDRLVRSQLEISLVSLLG